MKQGVFTTMKRAKISVGFLVAAGFLLSACLATDNGSVTQEPSTAAPPSMVVLEPAGLARRFDHFLPSDRQEGLNRGLSGLVRRDDGWQVVTVAYPPGTDSVDSDYAPATDRLLAWAATAGAGPGNLAAGQLSLITIATLAHEVAVPDNVVAAGWAPNGLDFAYILATPDTYELRWRAANGDDKLLAVDVPHSLRVSPDGRFVAFTRESHYGLAAEPGLYVVDVETGIETRISTLDRAGYGDVGFFWKPHWSPDGSQLLLYATADTDRAASPHEAGFVWAAADRSFSHFLPESRILAQFQEPLREPGAVRCLGAPLLIASNRLVLGVGECQPMAGGGPSSSQPATLALDPQTGAVDLVQMLSGSTSVELLTWDVPGESVLLREDGRIVSRSLVESAASPDCTESAALIADVTVTDGTRFEPNTAFSKTWRIKNTGTCTWDSRYELVHAGGHLMGALSSDFPLPGTVAPGETIDLTINLVSPSTAGTYQSDWKLQDPQAERFGVGHSGGPFWVSIVVATGQITTISGVIYQDSNENGVYDSGEMLVSDREVWLIPGTACHVRSEPIAKVRSGGDGGYTFSGNFSGSYCVGLAGPDGLEDVVGVSVAAGQVLTEIHLHAFIPSSANQSL